MVLGEDLDWKRAIAKRTVLRTYYTLLTSLAWLARCHVALALVAVGSGWIAHARSLPAP